MVFEPPILNEHVPLLRRVLAEDLDADVRLIGSEGEIIFLVDYDVTENAISIMEMLIASVSTGEHPPDTSRELRRKRDALKPHLGNKLLRAAVQCAGRRHEIVFDPSTSQIVHLERGELPSNQAPNYDPADRSTWLNMHLEWFKTVEDDPDYRKWIESTVFPHDFFDESVFEVSQTLYHVDVQDTLVEHAIYRGIEPAPFQKAELNDAIREAAMVLSGQAEAKWFHVNVHDNVIRSVEKFGRYSFDYPLVPIYIKLLFEKAHEGGTTYAGLASANRDWILLFTDELHISLHGPKAFVAQVRTSLGLNGDT